MIHMNIKQLKSFFFQSSEKKKVNLSFSSSENRLLPVAVLIGTLFYGTTALLFFMERIWKMFYFAHLCITYYVHTCIAYMFHVKCLCLLSIYFMVKFKVMFYFIQCSNSTLNITHIALNIYHVHYCIYYVL